MASLTIRQLDDQTKARLRIRGARDRCSMEDEARRILRAELAREEGGRASELIFDPPAIRRTRHLGVADSGARIAESIWSIHGSREERHLAGHDNEQCGSNFVPANAIRDDRYVFMAKTLNASAARELVRAGDLAKGTLGLGASVSADGKSFIFAPDGALWTAPLDAPGQAVRLTPDTWRARDPHYSLDGRWLAYVSAETGRDDVYVAPAADPTRKVQVSSGGGTRPTWRNDGQELYYLDSSNKLVAVSVQGNDSPELGSSTPLFSFRSTNVDRPYSPAADGQRFVIVRMGGQPSAGVRLMTNWREQTR